MKALREWHLISQQMLQEGEQLSIGETPKHWKHLWKDQVPHKLKCFTWLVAKKACLTQEVL